MTQSVQLTRLLDSLDDLRANGGGYMALCPAHDDRSPSLSVSEGDDGRLLLHCHGGCKTEDVVKALGLEMRDLFEETTGNGRPRQTATPKQTDEPNPINAAIITKLHAALTCEARSYLRQKRILTDEVIDRYQLGLCERNGQKRVSIPVKDDEELVRNIRLWMAPEFRDESDAGDKIVSWAQGYGATRLFPVDQLEHDELVLCEGELDALALIGHGVPAITLTNGADVAPNKQAAELFTDKTVTILMDHDDAGREGAEKRGEALTPFAAEVRIAVWPDGRDEKWDATDELRAHGVESVKNILVAAESFEVPEVPKAPSVTFGTPGVGLLGENEWPEPIPLPDALPVVEAFEPALLPDAFRPWVEDIADRMQCPPDFPAIGAMVTLSAVVGRQMTIRPKRRDDWAVVPNLWGGVVGRSGIMKSPAVSETLKPLHALEAQAREEYTATLQDYEATKLVAEGEKRHAQDEIKKAIREQKDPTTLAKELTSPETSEPARRRYLVNDTTVEKLGEILNANPRGVLLFRDELTGFLRMLDREGCEGSRAFYLEAWNGAGGFTFDRIGRGTIDIEAACVSILGGIQPGPLSAYMRRVAEGGGDDDGLVQRFQLVVWPDVPTAWLNRDTPPDLEARGRAYSVFERLDRIDPQQTEAECSLGVGEPPFLRFSPEAQEIFTEWRTELEHRIRKGDEPPMIESHLAKYRSLVPSLALLIHLADVGAGPVGEGALQRACAWADYLESHARRVYAPAISPAAASAHSLAQKIVKGELESTFTLRDVYRKHWQGLSTKEEAEEAIELLEAYDWGQRVTGKTGGRPTDVFVVNPKVAMEKNDG